MAMYINRAPGIMATPHSRAEADALGRRGPGPVRRLAAAGRRSRWRRRGATRPLQATRDEPSSSPSGPATDIVHSIALDRLTLAYLADDDIAEAVRVARGGSSCSTRSRSARSAGSSSPTAS